MCVLYILLKKKKQPKYWALNIKNEKFCLRENPNAKCNKITKLDIHKDLWENGILFFFFGKCVKRNLFSTWNVFISAARKTSFK